MQGNVLTALLLTAAAGLSTTIGSVIGLAVKNPGKHFMGFTLGFSAGVMIHVSFVELLQGAVDTVGFVHAHIAFLTGMLVMFVADSFIPHDYAGHHDHPDFKDEDGRKARLLRAGLLVALGIGLHNFPEGMATFAGALNDTRVGIAIAVAIAIHNIPEGLAVSAPVYAATGSRGKAFMWSFLSGVSEPLGAAIAALVLLPVLNGAVLGWLLASVAGVMVAISIDELIPTAKDYGSEHTPILGVIAGMLVMALSLHMLALSG